MRVLIVDDHAIVRKGIRGLLEDLDDVEFIDEASNGEEALAKTAGVTYDVVLLDVVLPGLSGFEVLDRLRRDHPKAAVLMLSMYSVDRFAIRAIKAGASGYLTKNRAPEELVAAIRKAAKGETFITSTVAELLADGLRSDCERPVHELLSSRELQVLRGIASGKRAAEIAAELAISVKTVSTYRTRIIEKTGLRSSAELDRFAVEQDVSEEAASIGTSRPRDDSRQLSFRFKKPAIVADRGTLIRRPTPVSR